MTDWRRGKGVFNKVKEAWNNLNKYGVIFGASVTATRVNHELLMSDEFWDYLAQNGVAYAWVFQFMPVGADASMDLVPTPEQRYEGFRKTGRTKTFQVSFAFVAEFWNQRFLTQGGMSCSRFEDLHINAKGYENHVFSSSLP